MLYLKGLTAASIAAAALFALAPVAFSASRPIAHAARTVFAQDPRYMGVCGECSWHSRIYDRPDPAKEECQNHQTQVGHYTSVIEVKD